MAWREDDSVLTQRFGKAGDRLWLRPVAVKAAVGALVAGDGAGGVYVASASGTKLSTAHILYDGSAGGAPAASSFETGSPGLRLDAASSDESGDLDIAFSSGAGGNGRVAEMTCLGAWTAPALSPPAAPFAALADDGSGGACALDQGDDARLWRLGAPGAALTLRPRAAALAYGDTLAASGYLTLDGTPLAGASVQLTPSTGTGPIATLTNAGGCYADLVQAQRQRILDGGGAGGGRRDRHECSGHRDRRSQGEPDALDAARRRRLRHHLLRRGRPGARRSPSSCSGSRARAGGR